ncbi:MAG TPA: trehalose-phosphatase [Gemmataceae bacterium]|jgi:trehalose 6-phosphate phosphatase|nr:trehalose-phosphatase [Gemmataceae bacterium]
MSRYLFDHLDTLGQRITHAPALLLFLNYDETLAAFADPAQHTELPPGLRQTLRALARMEKLEVAVFSGRNLAEVQALVGVPNIMIAGNHGLEIQTPECSFLEPKALALEGTLRDLAAELTRKLQAVAGVRIDGRSLAIVVDYTQASEAQWEDIRRVLHAALANASHPFVLTQADRSYEIRPRVYWNKKDAVQWIRDRVQGHEALPIYLGGDASDEEAFAALAEGITIRVGIVPESAAQYHVNEAHEVQEFLGWLANILVDKLHAEPRPASV